MRKLFAIMAVVALFMGCEDFQGSTNDNEKADTQSVSYVYITPSGSKFHRRSCSTIKNSRITAISRTGAINGGYTACKVCDP
jgi:hypothetical protein